MAEQDWTRGSRSWFWAHYRKVDKPHMDARTIWLTSSSVWPISKAGRFCRLLILPGYPFLPAGLFIMLSVPQAVLSIRLSEPMGCPNLQATQLIRLSTCTGCSLTEAVHLQGLFIRISTLTHLITLLQCPSYRRRQQVQGYQAYHLP